ncbi:MAG: hypothetical protein EOO41_00200 [Methanobacteriota archaeon]|nr:MAG: hypothetical protein EOO41_00200 [Euryarchaeota archaeon]
MHDYSYHHRFAATKEKLPPVPLSMTVMEAAQLLRLIIAATAAPVPRIGVSFTQHAEAAWPASPLPALALDALPHAGADLAAQLVHQAQHTLRSVTPSTTLPMARVRQIVAASLRFPDIEFEATSLGVHASFALSVCMVGIIADTCMLEAVWDTRLPLLTSTVKQMTAALQAEASVGELDARGAEGLTESVEFDSQFAASAVDVGSVPAGSPILLTQAARALQRFLCSNAERTLPSIIHRFCADAEAALAATGADISGAGEATHAGAPASASSALQGKALGASASSSSLLAAPVVAAAGAGAKVPAGAGPAGHAALAAMSVDEVAAIPSLPTPVSPPELVLHVKAAMLRDWPNPTAADEAECRSSLLTSSYARPGAFRALRAQAFLRAHVPLLRLLIMHVLVSAHALPSAVQWCTARRWSTNRTVRTARHCAPFIGMRIHRADVALTRAYHSPFIAVTHARPCLACVPVACAGSCCARRLHLAAH